MTAINDITGDAIATKGTSESYRNNFDAIFRKKPAEYVAPALETLTHQDGCRFWTDEEFCTCGAIESDELRYWKNQAKPQQKLVPESTQDELHWIQLELFPQGDTK